MAGLWFGVLTVLCGVARAGDFSAIPPGKEDLIRRLLVPATGDVAEVDGPGSIRIRAFDFEADLMYAGERVGSVRVSRPTSAPEHLPDTCRLSGGFLLCGEDGQGRAPESYLAWLSAPGRRAMLEQVFSKPVVQKAAIERKWFQVPPGWVFALVWILMQIGLMYRSVGGKRQAIGPIETLMYILQLSLQVFVNTVNIVPSSFWSLSGAVGLLTIVIFLASGKSRNHGEGRWSLLGLLGIQYGTTFVLALHLPAPFPHLTELFLGTLLFFHGAMLMAAGKKFSVLQRFFVSVGGFLLWVLLFWSAMAVWPKSGWMWAVAILPFFVAGVWIAWKNTSWKDFEGNIKETVLCYRIQWYLLIVILALVYIFAPKDAGLAWGVRNGLMWLGESLLSDGRARFEFWNGYFWLLTAAIAVLSLREFLIRRKRLGAIAGMTLFGGLAMLLPGRVLIENMGLVYPDAIWPEFSAMFWFLDGFLNPPPNPSFWGGPFLGSLFFRFFGPTPEAVNGLHLVGLMASGAALAGLVYVLTRNRWSAVLAASGLAVWSVTSGLALSGWWFFFGAAGICVSLALLLSSFEKPSSTGLFVLALLVTQFSLELRMETVLVFPLFLVYGSIAKRGETNPGKARWLLAFFIVNLLRILVRASGNDHFNGDWFPGNLLDYANIIGNAYWLLLAALGGAFFLYRRNPSVFLLSSLWFGGAFLFYGFVNTHPSPNEWFILSLPLFVLFGGLAPEEVDREVRASVVFRPAFCIVALLAVSGLLDAGRDNERRLLDGRIRLAKAVREVSREVPPGIRFLLAPEYTRLMMPSRPRLAYEKEGFSTESLQEEIGEESEVICVRTSECIENTKFSGHCCFLEFRARIRSDNGEEEVLGAEAVPAAWLNRKAEIFKRIGEVEFFRLLRMEPESEEAVQPSARDLLDHQK